MTANHGPQWTKFRRISISKIIPASVHSKQTAPGSFCLIGECMRRRRRRRRRRLSISRMDSSTDRASPHSANQPASRQHHTQALIRPARRSNPGDIVEPRGCIKHRKLSREYAPRIRRPDRRMHSDKTITIVFPVRLVTGYSVSGDRGSSGVKSARGPLFYTHAFGDEICLRARENDVCMSSVVARRWSALTNSIRSRAGDG